jgi:Ca2+-binding RTX toxin-like protein
MSGHGAPGGILIRVARALAAFALIAAIGAVLTATNTLPPTAIGQAGQPVTANVLKPGACGGISVSGVASGSGTFSGSGANDLVTAGPGADTITALGGADCVLGGAGDDDIDGGPGADVCIGGPGTDVFTDCETQIQ